MATRGKKTTATNSPKKTENQKRENSFTLDDIRCMMEDMFKQHEQSIINIISSNNKIVNERIDKMAKEVEELKESLGFTEQVTNEKISKLEINLLQENKFLKEKIRDIEDRSRRNNLRIDGVMESEKETWEETEEKVQNIFTNKLGIKRKIMIERAHRTKKKNSKNEERSRPATVVLKLLNYKDKQTILNNAKKLYGTGIYINEDFSRETADIRKKKWAKVLELRDQGKYAVLQYDQIISHDFRT